MYIEISNLYTRGLYRVWKTWKIWKMGCFLENLREDLDNSGNLNWKSFGSRKSQRNFRNVLSTRLLNSFLRFSFQFCNRLRFLRLHARTFAIASIFHFFFSSTANLEGLVKVLSVFFFYCCSRGARVTNIGQYHPLKTYLHYHNVHGHQSWQCGNLPWSATTHKATWPFDHVVVQDHVTN